MKRRLCSLALICSCVLMMAACQSRPAPEPEPQETEVRETTEQETVELSVMSMVETSDGAGGLTATDEEWFWSPQNRSYHADPDAPARRSIQFEGEQYDGVYQYSYVKQWGTEITDVYETRGGKIQFSVGRRTGEMLEFFDMGAGSAAEGKEPVDCAAYAEKLARQYIDVEQYVYEVLEGEYIQGYQYTRYLGGCKTCDFVIVALYSNGELSSIGLGTGSSFAAAMEAMGSERVQACVAALTAKEAEDAAIGQLEELCRACAGDEVTYEIRDRTLVFLEDGRMAMAYDATIRARTAEPDLGEDGWSERGTLCSVLVIAEA